MKLNNFLPDINRFKLAGPPDYWLRQLHEFDSSLVVVPSRQGFYYRLAQKRPPNLPAKFVNDMLWQESDTQMLATYGLIPVTTILATANWSNPLMWQELAERAPHRQGGSDAVIKHIETRERAEELKKAAEQDDYRTRLSSDAWRMYRKKIGVTSHAFVAPKQKPEDHNNFRASKAAPAIIIPKS